MFITLEKLYGTSKVDARIFITLERAFEVGEGITIIIKCNTPKEVVTGTPCLVGIPPNPPDMGSISIISTRGDHLWR